MQTEDSRDLPNGWTLEIRHLKSGRAYKVHPFYFIRDSVICRVGIGQTFMIFFALVFEFYFFFKVFIEHDLLLILEGALRVSLHMRREAILHVYQHATRMSVR